MLSSPLGAWGFIAEDLVSDLVDDLVKITTIFIPFIFFIHLSFGSSSSKEIIMTAGGTMERGLGERNHASSFFGLGSQENGGVEAMASGSMSSLE